MERNWHPEALKFDLLEGSEKEILKKSLQETKGNRDNPIEYRLIKGKREYLDGRNRATCCDELGIKPNERAVNVRDNQLRNYFIRKNVARRHLLTKTRQEWVADLRSDGQSVRQISETIGVPRSTVARDVIENRENNSSVPNGTPETIIGKDKKQWEGSRPQLLCPACQTRERKHQPKRHACPECTKLKRDKKAKKQAAPTELKDNFGNVIPAKLKHAWGDTWIQDTYDLFAEMLDDLLQARVPAGVNKRAKYFPFFRHKDINDGCGFIQQYLDQIIEHIRDNRPAGVCPSCEGKGCHHCKECGMVPKALYEKLMKAK